MNMGGPPTPDPADRPSAPDEPAQDWAPVTDDDPPPRRSPATSLPDDVKVAPLDPAAAPARPSGGAHRTPRREPHAPPPGPPGPAPQAGAPSAADTAPPERDPRPLTTAPPSPRPAD
ncbi:OmpA family protein, partial [Thermomonospora catenispora]